MYTIGLTGGPGVGKSEVAGILRDNNAIIISGDKIGRDVVNKNPNVLAKLVKSFGADILLPDKKIDRAKLGAIVFNNNKEMQKLNSIVHPPLLKMMKDKITANRNRFPKKLIVVDAALIFEWSIADWFDYILVVTAKRDIRIGRMVEIGLNVRNAAARISSQIPQRNKVKLADFVIINNSTKTVLRKRVMSFLTALKSVGSIT